MTPPEGTVGGGEKKIKSKTSSSSAKKLADKKKKAKKSSSSSSGAALYSIERSLLSFKGNDASLTEFLNSIDEKKFLSASKSKVGAASQTLEVDVVVDLLLAVARCFGQQQHQWSRVLLWFEGVAARSGAASFSFVTAMLSVQQKAAMSAVLDSIPLTSSSGSEGEGVRERISNVRAAYELN